MFNKTRLRCKEAKRTLQPSLGHCMPLGFGCLWEVVFELKKYRVVVNEREYIVSVEELVEESTDGTEMASQGPVVQSTAAPSLSVPASPDPVEVGRDGSPVEAPLRGAIMSIRVSEGDTVQAGDVLLTLEAMKLENEITAPSGGVVGRILVKEGDAVELGDVLVTLQEVS